MENIPFSYDLMNRMTEASISTPVADGQTGEVTYDDKNNTNVYNEGGQRMSKTEEGTTEKYFYTGGATLYTQDDNGTMLTENILDLSGNIIASKRFDDDDDPETPNEWEDQYYFYHYDIRGSVTAIVKPDGDSVKEYTYDEFGNLEEEGEASFDNEVTFTGSVTDTSTGLQYMNARYYNASTGRFLTQDTYTGNPYDPWTQHLYVYCGNNPTNFIDPTGHSFISAIRSFINGILNPKRTSSVPLAHTRPKTQKPVNKPPKPGANLPEIGEGERIVPDKETEEKIKEVVRDTNFYQNNNGLINDMIDQNNTPGVNIVNDSRIVINSVTEYQISGLDAFEYYQDYIDRSADAANTIVNIGVGIASMVGCKLCPAAAGVIIPAATIAITSVKWFTPEYDYSIREQMTGSYYLAEVTYIRDCDFYINGEKVQYHGVAIDNRIDYTATVVVGPDINGELNPLNNVVWTGAYEP